MTIPNNMNFLSKLFILLAAIVVLIGSNGYIQKKSSSKNWEGKWILKGSVQDYAGTLIIKSQTNDSFSYTLDTFNGAIQGNLVGTAEIIGNRASSVVKDTADIKSQCQIDFERIREDQIIIKTTNSDCYYFRGVGGFFAGTYLKNGPIKERALKDLHIFKNNDESNAFSKLVGDKYIRLFTDSFQQVSRIDDKEHLNARIYTGGVAGLYTILEGIIIIGPSNKIWAAAIDGNDVRYFTNVPDNIDHLPQAIDEWRGNFRDKNMIFMNGTGSRAVKNYSESEAKVLISEQAAQTILAIKNEDFSKLSTYAHPRKGVRFSPNSFVNVKEDLVLSANIIKISPNDPNKYVWGSSEGSGHPIELGFLEYYKKYVYSEDFANAKEIAYNRIIGKGNTINNVFDAYPNCIVVEYYFPGFDPKYEGMDWKSLRLVFEELNGKWYLVGIIHDQWSI